MVLLDVHYASLSQFNSEHLFLECDYDNKCVDELFSLKLVIEWKYQRAGMACSLIG
jgi:hypothetical protein